MPVAVPALADPEIAAATFKSHLDQLWNSDRTKRLGWEKTEIDSLHTLVKLPATRPTKEKEIDHYYFRLGAKYYDVAPPTVELVQPDGMTQATNPSPLYPVFAIVPPWFQLHSAYPYPGGPGQLVCFSFAAEYYMTNHSPKETERWQQGEHTVSATLNRLAEVLSSKYYLRPSA
jgi:hypothetical protein